MKRKTVKGKCIKKLNEMYDPMVRAGLNDDI